MNLNGHWIMICINYLDKKIQFLDPATRVFSAETALPENTMKYVTDNLVMFFIFDHFFRFKISREPLNDEIY